MDGCLLLFFIKPDLYVHMHAKINNCLQGCTNKRKSSFGHLICVYLSIPISSASKSQFNPIKMTSSAIIECAAFCGAELRASLCRFSLIAASPLYILMKERHKQAKKMPREKTFTYLKIRGEYCVRREKSAVRPLAIFTRRNRTFTLVCWGGFLSLRERNLG